MSERRVVVRTELSDLLHEAARGAPPPRYDVEDAVRAGKRRQRRRRTGWMAGAALAVAVAVTVPQLMTHQPQRTQPARPTPSVTPVGKPRPINFTFGGYAVGRFTVSAPFRWTLAGMTAEVRKEGGDPASPEGILTVYHPGVADPLAADKGVKRTATPAIGGRPAYLATHPGLPVLVWQYADDAYAIIAPSAADALTKAEMRQVAVAFRAGTASPVRVPFRITVVPPGYRLVQAQWEPSDGLSAMTRFLPVSVATPRISDVDHGPAPDPRSRYADQLRIEVVKPVPGEFAGTSSAGTQCPDAKSGGYGGRCYRWLPGDKYVVEALCRAVDKQGLTRLVDGLEVADLGKRATWFPANRAVPASAQVGGE
jgi:hypothetical protein